LFALNVLEFEADLGSENNSFIGSFLVFQLQLHAADKII
jgi:hypothetical protein